MLIRESPRWHGSSPQFAGELPHEPCGLRRNSHHFNPQAAKFRFAVNTQRSLRLSSIQIMPAHFTAGTAVNSPSRIYPLALLAVALVCGCAGNSQGSGSAKTTRAVATDPNSLLAITEGFDESVRRDVEKLRNATVAYHDVRVAQAAGYPTNLPKCIADSTMGGMGRHYFDRKIYDATLDVTKPEMLIYAPDAAGKPDKLAGVEFVVPFTLVPSTEKPPRLFGQELRRHEEFKYWYLHVWAWKHNKAGLFADWDPSTKCPVGG